MDGVAGAEKFTFVLEGVKQGGKETLSLVFCRLACSGPSFRSGKTLNWDKSNGGSVSVEIGLGVVHS
jgi:hypothetical protein